MMAPRKKKLYLAIIGLGVVALAVDRWVLTGSATMPAGAAASVTDSMTVSIDGSSAQDAGLPIPELPFPRGLEKFDSRPPIRDVFAPPGLVPRHGNDVSARELNGRGGNSDLDPQRLSSLAFAGRYQLDGVLVREGLKIAIVNGAWLRTGQSLQGCTLTEVAGNEAVFECYDDKSVLKVKNSDIR